MLPSFLRFGYWFNVSALPFLPLVDRMILTIILLLVVGGGGGYVYLRSSQAKNLDKYARRLWRSVSVALCWFGIVGLVLYAMTWLRVPILSMRVWWVIWLGLAAWIASRLIRWARKEIPAERRLHAERAAYEKWLPKPKHK